jgi:curved DNA-binding protein CbpA
MADPYEVLELPRHAGEGEIRKRYLELVRAFPPEQAPERFAAVHAAYQALRDPAARLEAQLFGLELTSDSLEALAEDVRQRLRQVRPPVETLLSLADSP